jgi:hypothetical protein
MMEPKVLYILGKYSITELRPQLANKFSRSNSLKHVKNLKKEKRNLFGASQCFNRCQYTCLKTMYSKYSCFSYFSLCYLVKQENDHLSLAEVSSLKIPSCELGTGGSCL